MPLGMGFSQQRGQFHNGVVFDKKIAGTADALMLYWRLVQLNFMTFSNKYSVARGW